MDLSLIERLSILPSEDRAEILSELSEDEAELIRVEWRATARPKQLAPGTPGAADNTSDWRVWLGRCGRGFGKTRMGAGWIHERAEQAPGRWIALVAKTPADARDYMIEGPGGLMKHKPNWVIAAGPEWPNYEPSKRRISWPNGSWATIYSSEEPDQLRGFSGDTAWLDELAKYRNPGECWDNLQMGMRECSNDRPRVCITTTPRPIALLKSLEAMPSTVLVTGSSYDNETNLDPTWFSETLAQYEGTRYGRQEIWAEILEDVPGALWKLSQIDACRVAEPPEMVRVVVAIDPAVTSSETSDETGIVVAGVGKDGHGYVLADASGKYSPDGWAREAVALYHRWKADRIVAEVNNGGDMVEATLRTVDPSIPYKGVHASRGKQVRAEPVAALTEQGKIHHLPGLAKLEDQLTQWDPAGKCRSPDRLDAFCWALTELLLEPDTSPVMGGYRSVSQGRFGKAGRGYM